jgi:hypothetical protein
MYIDGFIWLPDIVEKLLARHHVTEDEVESVFFNKPRFALSNRDTDRKKTL